MPTIIPSEPRSLISEHQAAALIGRDICVIRRLRAAGVLTSDVAECHGHWRRRYARSEVELTRAAIDNCDRLRHQGTCNLDNEGHLWVLQKVGAESTKTSQCSRLKIVDLCTKGYAGRIYVLPKAAQEFDIPLYRLKTAIANGGVRSEKVAVNVEYTVLLDKDLAKFKLACRDAARRAVQIDRNKWGSTSDLFACVGVQTNSDKFEVSECARLWSELGKLPYVECEKDEPGSVPMNWEPTPTGERRFKGRKSLMRRRRRVFYDKLVFKGLWNEDLKTHIKAFKHLILSGIVTAKEVRTEMKKRGVTGRRFGRVARLAGAVPEKSGNGRAPWVYALRHRGPSPKRKEVSLDIAKRWLLRKLTKHPLPAGMAYRIALNEGLTKGSLWRAFRALGCERRNVVRRIWWCLPGQDLSPEGAQHFLARDHQNAVVNGRDRNLHATAGRGRGAPMAGAASRTDEVPSPRPSLPQQPYPVVIMNSADQPVPMREIPRRRAEKTAGQFVLHANDWAILEVLAQCPSETMHQVDIETGANLSRKTVSKRLRYLRRLRLVHRPHGDRGGEAITDAGREALESRHSTGQH